jgi:hypothetical protein
LETLAFEARKAGEECLALAKAELQAALKKYSPDQPRVPAGNPAGGRWTKGDDGNGSSSDFSGAARDLAGAPTRYAARETGTLIDATEVPEPRVLYAQDAPIDSLDVAAAPPAKYHVIGSDEIPADSPKHPVQFVDSLGEPILDDQGNPILRPADRPPELYAQAGLAANSLPVKIHQFIQATQAVANGLLKPSALIEMAAEVASELYPFTHGGSLDAERFDSNYFAIIAITLVSRLASLRQRRASTRMNSSQSLTLMPHLNLNSALTSRWMNAIHIRPSKMSKTL